MTNGTWKRSTAASRRAERRVRYVHVSVLVGVNKDEATGMLTATRTPKGEGSTATRAKPKTNRRGAVCVKPVKGHDWLGLYPGRLATLETAAWARRSAHRWEREENCRKTYFDAKLQEALNV
jgi:hypothetical protein